MKEEWNELSAFMAANLNEFQPCAYFDKHMDCIRVKIIDCSVTDVRLTNIFTVLQPNHGRWAKEGKNVGFTIKGVAHLFKHVGLPMSGVLDLVQILDAIVKCFPDAAVKQVTEEFSPVIRERNLRVTFEEEEAIAA